MAVQLGLARSGRFCATTLSLEFVALICMYMLATADITYISDR